MKLNDEIIKSLCYHFSLSEAKEILQGGRRVRLEIGRNLLTAIEKLINHNEFILTHSSREWSSDSVYSTGHVIQAAFGIDFTKMSTITESIGDVSATRPVGFEDCETEIFDCANSACKHQWLQDIDAARIICPKCSSGSVHEKG